MNSKLNDQDKVVRQNNASVAFLASLSVMRDEGIGDHSCFRFMIDMTEGHPQNSVLNFSVRLDVKKESN